MNLREHASFRKIAAPLVRNAKGSRLGLSDRLARVVASAQDNEAFVVARASFSGFAAEGAAVQQEGVARQWHEGFRFYHPEKRLFVLWVIQGFFRSVVRNDTVTLTDIKSIQARAQSLHLGISRATIANYLRDGAVRKGWWSFRESDLDARVRQVVPSQRQAYVAHLSHLCSFTETYAVALRKRRKALLEKIHTEQWCEMGYRAADLENIAKFIRQNRDVTDSHI